MKANSHREAALDGLRGLAIIAVVVHSVVLLIPAFSHAVLSSISADPFHSVWDSLLGHSPLHLFWAEQEMLILFLVLSAMVLTLQLDTEPGGLRFIGKRLLRVYAPYLVSVVLGLILLHLQRPHVTAPTLLAAARDAVLTLNDETLQAINPTLGVLMQGIRLSLVFPILLSFVRRGPGKWLAVLFGLAAVAHAQAALHPELGPVLLSWLGTVSYTFYVALGMFLALRQAALRDFLDDRAGWTYWLWLSIAMLLLDFKWEAAPALGDRPSGIGALLLILLALQWRSFATLLHRPIFQGLGRLSFSLFLTHFLVLDWVIAATRGWRLWEQFTLIGLLTLLVAGAFYGLVENPFHQLARLIGKDHRHDRLMREIVE